MKAHCRADYMAHCMGVPPGGREALQCMQRNFANLSPGCKTRGRPHHAAPLRAAKAAHRRMREEDARTAHAAAAAGGADRASTPAAAGSRHGDGARRAIAAAATRARIFRACNQDQAVVCPGVPAGGGRIIACLAMHADALSPFCRRAVGRAMR